jgi:hypothetical protein
MLAIEKGLVSGRGKIQDAQAVVNQTQIASRQQAEIIRPAMLLD